VSSIEEKAVPKTWRRVWGCIRTLTDTAVVFAEIESGLFLQGHPVLTMGSSDFAGASKSVLHHTP
jgi:hypothetical protein